MEWWSKRMYVPKVETEVHACIQGHGIGAKFLAHLKGNNNRVIGFVREKVEGRPATYLDLPFCQLVLSKLHRYGYLLRGGLHRFSFIIQEASRTAVILKFGDCERSDEPLAFKTEMQELEAALRRESHRLDPNIHVKIGWDMMMQIDQIADRDDGANPIFFDQAVKGEITITEKEHRWLLYEWRKKIGCANNFPPVIAPGPGKL